MILLSPSVSLIISSFNVASSRTLDKPQQCPCLLSIESRSHFYSCDANARQSRAKQSRLIILLFAFDHDDVQRATSTRVDSDTSRIKFEPIGHYHSGSGVLRLLHTYWTGTFRSVALGACSSLTSCRYPALQPATVRIEWSTFASLITHLSLSAESVRSRLKICGRLSSERHS